MFTFSLKTKVKFGQGSCKDITETLKSENWENIGVVYDHNLLENRDVLELLDLIENTSSKLVKAECTISEPTYDSLDDVRGQFEDPTLQVIIGIGGGSTIDMAKAIAVLLKNKKPAISYRGFDQMTDPVLPIIAIPTTAGTGSEVTPNASFIDTKEKKKLGINGEAIRPTYAFLDPQLTLTCPKAPSISTGVDSMVHAVEAFAAKKTNRIARFFAIEGFNRVFDALPRLIDNLNDIRLREEVMYGAFLSGVALMHSGTGPAAAMSYPLSVYFHVPHGLGGALFLPHVIAYNIKAGYKDYSELYNPNRLDKQLSLEFFLKTMQNTWEKLSVPNTLSPFNIHKVDIPLIIDETMQLRAALDQNPVPFYENEIRQVLDILTEN